MFCVARNARVYSKHDAGSPKRREAASWILSLCEVSWTREFIRGSDDSYQACVVAVYGDQPRRYKRGRERKTGGMIIVFQQPETKSHNMPIRSSRPNRRASRD
ncbi:hypothetical protein EDB92DRAFT_2106209 [Lactarius akahatsu]|uniref:Uncharacterized protein n=1 Tax=Lactarius akahatsu TaxID=416441 RepID=A0AAD4Q9S4_9AGAM|nr:hypothetical protein EDB92DRAFT_2106209 [Lactarius akahatsu]